MVRSYAFRFEKVKSEQFQQNQEYRRLVHRKKIYVDNLYDLPVRINVFLQTVAKIQRNILINISSIILSFSKFSVRFVAYCSMAEEEQREKLHSVATDLFKEIVESTYEKRKKHVPESRFTKVQRLINRKSNPARYFSESGNCC